MEQKIKRMEFLLKKITPAPWSYTGAEVESPYNYWVARRILGSEWDPEFIAQSRNLMPALLKERIQRKEIAEELFEKISKCYGNDKEQNRKIAEISKLIRENLL